MEFVNKLYEDIGKKIKNLAKWTFIVESIAGIISVIGAVANESDLFEDMPFLILVFIVLIPIVAFVSSWILYGFGEIIDKLNSIEKNTRGDEVENNKPAAPADETFAANIKSDFTANFKAANENAVSKEYKTCSYCGKKVASDTERCDCGCLVFNE